MTKVRLGGACKGMFRGFSGTCEESTIRFLVQGSYGDCVGIHKGHVEAI